MIEPTRMCSWLCVKWFKRVNCVCVPSVRRIPRGVLSIHTE